MDKTIQTFRYLSKSLVGITAIEFFVILGSVAISDLVYFVTDYAYNTIHPVATLSQPLEVTSGIFSLMIGLVAFLINFKVGLANGISRKTFVLANLPVAAMAAAAFSIFNLVVIQIHSLFWPMSLMSTYNTPNIGWAGTLILQFALYLMLIVAGWFVALAYYRSNVPVRWAISLSPFILFALLQQANARTEGAVFEAIWNYLLWSFDLSRAVPTMLVYAAILYGLVFLLIRRAALKD